MIRRFSALIGLALALAACGENVQTATLQTPPGAPPQPKAWMVFFDTNSTALSPQSTNTLLEASGVAKQFPAAKVTVTGYTDTDGSPAYNQALSVRRANAVRDALVKSGVAAQSITVSGAGEQELLVPTADQTKNPNNRRVQVVVQ
jgi:outer membrane protein OmpA-like peptidoglycan-associated protein